MRRIVVGLAVSALMAASAQAMPSLGYWDESATGATHQYWDFTPGHVNPLAGGGLEAIPEEVDNPAPTGVKIQLSAGTTWDQRTTISGGLLVLDMKIANYPALNDHKDVWVDLGLTNGTVFSATVLAGDGEFRYEILQPDPQGAADFGFRIYPNPQWEDVQLVILGTTAPAEVDYVHIDTICVPAPGALVLSMIGTGFLGWVRRRRAL